MKSRELHLQVGFQRGEVVLDFGKGFIGKGVVAWRAAVVLKIITFSA